MKYGFGVQLCWCRLRCHASVCSKTIHHSPWWDTLSLFSGVTRTHSPANQSHLCHLCKHTYVSHRARRCRASWMYPRAPWEPSADWAGNIWTRFPIKQGNSDQHASCKMKNRWASPCSKLLNEHQIMMQGVFSSPCVTKRYKWWLQSQTPHLVSVQQGNVALDLRQEDIFCVCMMSASASLGQFPLKQASEVKMLSVCQLHRTYYFLLYHISS